MYLVLDKTVAPYFLGNRKMKTKQINSLVVSILICVSSMKTLC